MRHGVFEILVEGMADDGLCEARDGCAIALEPYRHLEAAKARHHKEGPRHHDHPPAAMEPGIVEMQGLGEWILADGVAHGLNW